MSVKRQKKSRRNRADEIEEQAQAVAIEEVFNFTEHTRLPAGMGLGHLFDNRFHVFAFMKSIENQPKRRTVVVTSLIEALQLIGFTLNPRYRWSGASKFAANAVYFFQLPLWDPHYFNISHGASTAVFFVLCAVLLGMMTLGILRCVGSAEQPAWTRHYRLLLSVVGGIGQIVIFQHLLAMMVCKDDQLGAFPSQSCSGSLTQVVVAFGVPSAALLCLFSLLSSVVLFESNPSSSNWTARSHTQADFFMWALKTTVCVLYHHFFAFRDPRWFCLFTAVGFSVAGTVWAVTQPFYRSGVTRSRVAMCYTAAWCGALSGILESEKGKNTIDNGAVELLLLIAGFVGALLLADKVTDSRINTEYVMDMKRMCYQGLIRSRQSELPRGLNGRVSAFPALDNLVKVMVPADSDPEDDTPLNTTTYHFTTPYIRHVYRAEDLELACRFLGGFRMQTGRAPTTAMLQYALLLFVNGMVMFRNSGMLLFHFAQFVHYQLQFEAAAVRWLQGMESLDVSLPVRYQAWKLTQLLKVDNTYMQRFAAAKQAHSHCLRRMQDFWRLLQAERIDDDAMNACAVAIREHSDEALVDYQRALRFEDGERPFARSDVPLGVNYGLFLEQIMMSSELSDTCFQIVGEFCSMQKTRAMAGARRRNKNKVEISVSQLPQNKDIQIDGGEGGHQMDAITGGKALSSARMVVNAVFVFLVLLLLLFLLLAAVVSAQRKLVIHAASTGGKVRALSSQASFLLEEMMMTSDTHRPEDPLLAPDLLDSIRGFPASRDYLQQKLLGVTRDLHTSFNSITWGKYSSGFQMWIDFLTQDYLGVRSTHNLTLLENTSGTQQLPYEAVGENLWVAVYRSIEVLYSLQNDPIDSIPQDDGRRKFVLDNTVGSIADGLNRSQLIHEDWTAEQVFVMGTSLFSIYIVCIILVATAFGVLVTRFKGVERTNSCVRSVVTLVPVAMMKALEKTIGKRSEEFDQYTDHPDQFLVARRYVASDRPEEDAADMKAALQKQEMPVVQEDDSGDPEVIAAEIRKKQERALLLQSNAGSSAHVSRTFNLLFLALSATCVAQLAVCVNLYSNADTLRGRTDSATLAFGDVAGGLRTNLLLENLAASFSLQPSKQLYEQYWEYHTRYLADPGRRRRLLEATAPCCGVERAQLVYDVFLMQEKSLRDHLYAMKKAIPMLQATDPNFSWDDFRELQALNLTEYELSNVASAREFGKIQTESSIDENHSLIFGDVHAERYLRSNHAWVLLHEDLSTHFRNFVSDQTDVARLFRRICYILAGVCALVACLVTRQMFKEHMPWVMLLQMMVLLTVCLSIASCIVLASDERTNDSKSEKYSEEVVQCDLWPGRLAESQDFLVETVRAFSQRGELKFVYTFLEHKGEPAKWRNKLEVLASRELAGQELEQFQAGMEAAWLHVAKMNRLETISMTLAHNAYGGNMTDQDISALTEATWDEADAASVPTSWRRRFRDDPLRFTNSTYDLTLPKSVQLQKARRTVLAGWFVTMQETFDNEIDDLTSGLCGHLRSVVTSTMDDARTLRLVAVVICAGMVFLQLLLFGSLLATLLRDQKPSADSTSLPPGQEPYTSSEKKSKSQGLLSVHLRRMAWALAFVGVLVTVTFAMTYRSLLGSVGVATRMHESSARAWLTSRAMFLADRYVQDASGKHSYKAQLRHTAELMRRTEDNLFFAKWNGSSSSVYSGVGMDSAQDALLFSSTASLPRNYQQCNATLDAVTAHRIRNGISLLYQSWREKLVSLSYADDPALIASLVRVLREDVGPLLDGLHRSNELYESQAVDTVDAEFVIVLIVVIGSMVTMVFVFVRVFRPLVQELRNEEETTRLMLRLIPQEARELPEIVELLGGIPAAGDTDRNLLDAVTELSPYPLIAIDDKGIVLKSTQAALKETFGYSANEIAGSNVSVLMPQRFARNHDQYLANYRRTRHKRVIGQLRRLIAKRKDGTEFASDVLIREHTCLNGDKVFIGFLKDVGQTEALKAEAAMDRTIRESADTPIIAIDDSGIIVQANDTASVFFGHAKPDLIGQNVKMLTTSEVMPYHDQYIQRYKQTKQKHVIGRQTRVTAQKKSGETVKVELMVQEVITHGKSTFVGFIRDVSEEEAINQVNLINAAVANMSPIPIIVIDPIGTVLRYSGAGEVVFGWPERKVVNNNIKMLMPKEIADNHDMFLERYMRTGIARIVGTTREVVGKKADGSVFPMSVTVAKIEKDGEILAFVGYARNIEEQKKQQLEQDIAAVVSMKSSVPIITINIQGEVLSFSLQASVDFGYEEQEVVGNNVKMLMPADFASKHDSFLKAYATTQVKKVIGTTRQVQALRKDGTLFPLQLAVNEIKEEDMFTQDVYVGFATNLEERNRLERTFSVNEAVNHISAVPIVAINSVGIINRFSRAAEQTWGFTANEIIGQNVSKLMPPAIGQHHDGYLSTYARTRQKNVIDTTRRALAVRKNGMEFPVSLNVFEVLKQGTDPLFVGFVRDTSADEAQQRAVQLNQQITDICMTPIFVIDAYGKIVSANRAAHQTFQYAPEDLLGKNVKVVQPPDVASRHDGFLEKYRRTRVKGVIDTTRRVTAKRKDKTTFPARITVREVTETRINETVSMFVGYIQDIPEYMHLEESNRSVDTVLNLSSVPVVAIEGNGQIIKFSRTAEEVFGYQSSEVLGMNVKLLMPEHIAKDHDNILATYRRTGKKTVIDAQRVLPAVDKKGTPLSVEACIKEVVQPGGSVFIGYLRDARADCELQRQEAIISSIHSLSTYPIIVMDTQGTIKNWNPAAAQFFGYTAPEIVGVHNGITMLQPPEIAHEHQSYIDTYLKTGRKRVIDTVRRVPAMTPKTGRVMIEISVREMVHRDGSRVFLGYTRDLTEELQREQHGAVAAAVASLSMNPLIRIDVRGTILQFSASSCRTFGFTEEETLGKNIKMLMPEHIAVHHDEFLQRYVDTGVKHVIDTDRAVTGQRKNGENFPCQITVREVTTEGEESSYVGYLVDISDQRALELTMRAADTVAEHASVPLIQISQVGEILKFNKAASQAFVYEASAVIGKNIKMLMPDEFAKNHDYYLRRYLDDGIKRVVGIKRNVQALRSDKTTFPVEISVREIIATDGKSRVYAGYVQDATTSVFLQQAITINDAITAISPVAVIAISSKGIVFKFSPAAENLFGFKSEEMRGKNVGLLMPDNIRKQHDGFLKRYAKTGMKRVIDKVTTGFHGKRKNGTLFPLELTVKELTKEGQGDSIFVASARDASDSIRASNEFSLASAMQNASPLPIIGITSTGEVTKFSTTACSVFGWAEEDIVGNQIELLMPEHIAANHAGYLQRYLTTGVKRVVDTTRRVTAKRKDGATFELELLVKEIKTEGYHLFIGYLKDLTQENELKLLLRVSVGVTELLDNPLITTTAKGVVKTFNQAATEMFNFSPAEILGKNVRILMPEDAVARHDQAMQNYLRTGRKRVLDTRRTVVAETKEGEQFEVDILVKEIKETDGSVVFIGSFFPKAVMPQL
eukprot:TRINITY_DN6045_c1_g1_i1.p1 TRINITY_DN6045_c1_g1~~TRINITY_DN6045_c1_g1_i1.p1  ORF type:complete len:3493 (+),score=1062.71 TRINITY_DN6045_c1_g1_i1:62-10540(+)